MSERGFEPLPEKLESIRKMPALRTAKEVKTIPWTDRILPKVSYHVLLIFHDL